ncbi:hypothetical protein GS534_24545 [Rhodococcus hoagii]|nr:hypothetical protein [Prescottella equi]MBM4617900.1 hypothetical protein [Prescottella equi]NKS33200.1 hypothetical protein [Prescottella equi]
MNSNFDRLAIAAIAAGLCGIGIGYASAPAPADNTTRVAIAGDDNSDGIIDEDESGWNCETMGNRICGPADYSIDECQHVVYTIPVDAIGRPIVCAPN